MRMAATTDLPSTAPSSAASLTSPMPIPVGTTSSGRNRKSAARNDASTHSSAWSG